MKTILITGSSGLVGSECVRHFSTFFDQIIGIDNNQREFLFGEKGSVSSQTTKNSKFSNYKHLNIDIRDFYLINECISGYKPDLIIHCAGQPSHEKSAKIPYLDFQINTVGTVNLLEAVRKFVPKSPFIFTSTNKVYGTIPNNFNFIETETRYDPIFCMDEEIGIDYTLHSPFGANKAAADLIVQEYGVYYGLNTVCFRCGCITGKNHAGVEQHGFLSYLVKTALNEAEYTIYGHNGKQGRDNIHAADLVSAFHEYTFSPIPGAVYNIGGGINNYCSILEAIQIIKNMTGKTPKIKSGESRKGDHLCYATDYNKFQRDYPKWKIKYSLEKIFQDLVVS